MICGNMSICHFPDKDNCQYFLKGFKDCFYNILGKCCNASAITESANRQDKNIDSVTVGINCESKDKT